MFTGNPIPLPNYYAAGGLTLLLILSGCSSDNSVDQGFAGYGFYAGSGGFTGAVTGASGSIGGALAAGQQTATAGTVTAKAGTGGTAGKSVNAGSGGAKTTTNAGAGAGAGGTAGSGTTAQANPVCKKIDASEFKPNLSLGGGGASYKESDHFIVFGASNPDVILNFMEAAHKCYVQDWCWRDAGLSVKSDESGPYYKFNVYAKGSMGAGGYMRTDLNVGLAYVEVLSSMINDPKTTVHEYGHALTYAAKGWVDQRNTGLWWESVANFVALTFLTSAYCEDARNEFGIKAASTIVDQETLNRVYNRSFTVILYSAGGNDSNHYQAWPIWTYLTNNPDNYPGIGRMTLPEMWKTHKGNNETPLHQLERMAAPVKAQTIIGRYWARMAYFDIGLPVGQQDFLKSRGSLSFGANLDSSGSGSYKVKSGRQPQYFGANITPLKMSGTEVSIKVTNVGNGLSESNFTATLSIRSSDGSVRYVDLPQGSGQATVASGEEVSLVVVNTPDTLYMYNPESVGSPGTTGLNYQVQITGATPSN
jgi:hypothetical protein